LSLNVSGHSIDGQPLNWHIKGDLKLSGMWEVSNTREEVPQNSNPSAPTSLNYFIINSLKIRKSEVIPGVIPFC
jgi:hypothetical protein